MNYPKELLPQESYKIIDTDQLKIGSSLIRKSKKNKQESIDNIGDVRIDAICEVESEKDVFGLSFNLFGKFNIEHLKIYVLNREFYDYWQPGQEIINETKIDFDIVESVFPIFFLIFDLHNINFPYKKHIKNKYTQALNGICKIEHKPTKCNYWHFEQSVYSSEEKYIKRSDSKWKVDIAKYILKTILKKNAFIDQPEKIELEKKLYMLKKYK